MTRRDQRRWNEQYNEGLSRGMTEAQAQDYADETCVDLDYLEDLDADERDGR